MSNYVFKMKRILTKTKIRCRDLYVKQLLTKGFNLTYTINLIVLLHIITSLSSKERPSLEKKKQETSLSAAYRSICLKKYPHQTKHHITSSYVLYSKLSDV